MRVIDIVIPVYNDNAYFKVTLSSVFNQVMPKEWCYHVYVVDDGSEEKVTIDGRYVDNTSILRLKKNSGCSVARNQGALAGNGEVVLFLDADCSLKHDKILSLLLAQYINGFDACFGQIEVLGDDFWAKYQRGVAKRRAMNFRAGDEASMSTACFMVKRKMFETVGGFDEEYHFGFEDRDLFLTLINSGARMGLEEKALVNHNDKLSLMLVAKKLYKSGASSSARFIKKHPKEYKTMHFAKADVRYSNGGLRVISFLASPVTWKMIRLVDGAINKRMISYFLAKKLVKYLSGLAYLHGTNIARS